MKEQTKNKQLIINLLAGLLSCVIGIGINMIVLPRLIKKFDFEIAAYIIIANDLANFVAILAMALNSMAGRFITIRLHQKDLKAANEYFNSILFANLAIIAALILPLLLLVFNIGPILDVEPALLQDVQLVFFFTFLNFMLTILTTTFSTSTFASNRIDLQSLRTIESTIVKALALFLLFTFLPIKAYYKALAEVIPTLYMLVAYLYYTKKLLPDIHLSPKHFKMSRILDVLSAGIWNTIMRAGQYLTNSLDTMIAKALIDTNTSGYIGTSKTIAIAINMLYDSVSAIFSPSLTITYATGNKEELVSSLRSSMKLSGFFANIPLCFMIGFGLSFYKVWLPTSNASAQSTIYILTILTMIGTIVGGSISPLFNVFTIVNKVKWNSIAVLIMGFLSIGIVFFGFKDSPYLMYAIVSVSSILGIIKNITFTPMYAAHCLGLKKTAFHPTIFRYMLVSILMGAIFIGLGQIIPATNWPLILMSILFCGIIGCILNFFLLFEKKEQDIFVEFTKSAITKLTGKDT